MAAKSARKSPAAKKAATPRKPRRKKAEPKSRGLSPAEVASDSVEYPTELLEAVREDGGEVLGVYRDPLGGHPVVFSVLPIDKVEPTPYQRDVSEPHVKRLANAMERLDRFLDPVIAVRKDGRYWTPNGNHRLNASRRLGAKAIVALVLPEEDVAYQILALNTEKAHNLKERSLEVIRMYRGLVGAERKGPETAFAHLFEEPAFITLGAAYEQRPRFSAGAYHPFVKAVEDFLDTPWRTPCPCARPGPGGCWSWTTPWCPWWTPSRSGASRARTSRTSSSPASTSCASARMAGSRTSTPPWTGCRPAPGSSTSTRCGARTLAGWAAGRWSRTRNPLKGTRFAGGCAQHDIPHGPGRRRRPREPRLGHPHLPA